MTMRFYNEQLKKYGATAQGCGWGSEESQQKRFDVLLEEISFYGSVVDTVLDVGCGCGDMFEHINAEDYTGIDINPNMIEAAKTKYPEGRFLLYEDYDIREKQDWVLASGIFAFSNYKELYQQAYWMFKVAKMGVAFNCLSAWGPVNPGEFTPDPTIVLKDLRIVTPKLKLRMDYLPNDFTIVMHK